MLRTAVCLSAIAQVFARDKGGARCWPTRTRHGAEASLEPAPHARNSRLDLPLGLRRLQSAADQVLIAKLHDLTGAAGAGEAAFDFEWRLRSPSNLTSLPCSSPVLDPAVRVRRLQGGESVQQTGLLGDVPKVPPRGVHSLQLLP